MNQMQKLFVFGVVCVGLYGCGGGNSELKPVTTAPSVDPAVLQAKREAMMKESMEKSKAAMAPANSSGQPAAPSGQ